MLTGQLPFQSMAIKADICAGRFQDKLPEVAPEVKALLGAMCALEPKERPTCQKLLQMGVFDQVRGDVASKPAPQRPHRGAGGNVIVTLADYWTGLPEKTEGRLFRIGVDVCRFVRSLGNGLRDLRPKTILVNRETMQFHLCTEEMPKQAMLSGEAPTAAFLSLNILDGESWGEADACWQIGVVLMALVCGESPFMRHTLRKIA